MKTLNNRIAGALLAAGLCCLLVSCAAAMAVTAPAGQVSPGDRVSVDLRDIPDNATFLLRITGTFTVTPGGEFSFSADNFQMPFSLLQSQVSATLQNTDVNVLSVKRGDLEVRKTGRSQGGTYSTVENANISAGTYDFLRLSGTALPDTDRVIANLELTGKKSGANSGTISFNIGGIQYGTVDVIASVDGNPVLSTTVAVVSTATPVPTKTPGTGSYTGGGGGGGGYVSAPAATTAQPTTLVTTAVPVANMTAATNATAVTTTVQTATPTPEQTPVPTTPVNTPTRSAMSVLPLFGLVIAAVFLAGRTRK